MSLRFEGTAVDVWDGDTVLDSVRRAGMPVPRGCGAGACQSCLLRTTEKVPAAAQRGLDDSLVAVGAFLACQVPAGSLEQVERLSDDLFPSVQAILQDRGLLAEDVLRVRFSTEGFPLTPGLFVRLSHENGVSRPYSIASSALSTDGLLDLHIRLIPGGVMSQLVQEVPLGETFQVRGPYGRCRYKAERKSSPILMIGSGTGLAPLYAVATEAIKANHDAPIRLFLGSTHGSRHYFREELAELENLTPNLEITYAVDAEPMEGDVLGTPLAHALQSQDDLDGTLVYLCGHPGLVKAAQKQCFLAGASMKDIFADPFEAAST